MSSPVKISHILMIWVFFFSIFVNILQLTGPLFMLQVYDRVLSSGSEETLLALVILIAALFFFMGLLDFARGRLLARIGARFQSGLDGIAFELSIRQKGRRKSTAQALNDLETVQQFFSSPAFLAFFDLPWSPLFFAAMFILHPVVGWYGIAAGGILVAVTLVNQWSTKKNTKNALVRSSLARHLATQALAGATNSVSQGMVSNLRDRWLAVRRQALGGTIGASDWSGGFVALSKTLRMFLQSAILGVGAWLTLRGEMSGGSMIAGSILLGRALAPIDQSIAQWANLQKARLSWTNLKTVFSDQEVLDETTRLPRPAARLDVRNVTVAVDTLDGLILEQVSLKVEPGQVLGVIGSSGSGKSTLARVIMGVSPPIRGEVRLGGATVEQYGAEAYAEHVGYLPQDVFLFDGTIAENIARMAAAPNDEQVVKAAMQANAHEMILALPKGYQTPIDRASLTLSGGQQQRIALARALYGDPVLLVLDEPNSALDSVGSAALNRTIRMFKSEDRAVVLMTHRPTAIAECDTLMILDQGRVKAYGPKDDVLQAHLKNAKQIKTVAGASGQ